MDINGLLARSVPDPEISAQALYKSSLGKISVRDLLARSAEKVARAISKIRTAPQREGSDTHEVLRRLRERSQNSHRTTTTGIRHAQSDKRVSSEVSATVEMHMDISQGTLCAATVIKKGACTPQ